MIKVISFRGVPRLFAKPQKSLQVERHGGIEFAFPLVAWIVRIQIFHQSVEVNEIQQGMADMPANLIDPIAYFLAETPVLLQEIHA